MCFQEGRGGRNGEIGGERVQVSFTLREVEDGGRERLVEICVYIISRESFITEDDKSVYVSALLHSSMILECEYSAKRVIIILAKQKLQSLFITLDIRVIRRRAFCIRPLLNCHGHVYSGSFISSFSFSYF